MLFREICSWWIDGSPPAAAAAAPSMVPSLGWPIDHATLRLQRCRPLSAHKLIDLVLIPELTCVLIKA